MKRNSCYLKVVGTREMDQRRWGANEEWPVKSLHSSSRPDHTQTRPIKQWVIMHYMPMKAVRDHLLLGCPCCQPGVLMTMFVDRARKIGYVNKDVVKLIEWVHRGRPTKLTLKALNDIQSLKALYEVQRSWSPL